MKRIKKRLNELKRRTSSYGDGCIVCFQDIEPGEQYYDGGYGRRAHISCGDAAEVKPEIERTKAEFRNARSAIHSERARRLLEQS